MGYAKKMRTKTPLLLAALALWVTDSHAGAPDTCAFDEPIVVRIVTYASQAALAAKYRALVPAARRIELSRREALVSGFATREGDVHTLHVLAGDWEGHRRQLAVLGHELLHAFCGRWHPQRY